MPQGCMLRAQQSLHQVGIMEKPIRSEAATAPGAETEAGGTSSWSRVAAQGLPAKSPAASPAGELPHHHASPLVLSCCCMLR